jgi:Tfp pilus assembly protein PilF
VAAKAKSHKPILFSDKKALADYVNAVRGNPAQVSALLKQAMLHQRLNQRREAADVYLTALKTDPKLAVAYNNLAWMATETGEQLERAEKWSQQAIALASDVPDFHDTLGWVHRARGNYDEAERVLRHAPTLKRASASTHYHLGVVQNEQGKNEAAIAAFKRALALDPKHREAEDALRKLERR